MTAVTMKNGTTRKRMSRVAAVSFFCAATLAGMATSAQAYTSWTETGYHRLTQERAAEDLPGLQQTCRSKNGQVSSTRVIVSSTSDYPVTYLAQVFCYTR